VEHGLKNNASSGDVLSAQPQWQANWSWIPEASSYFKKMAQPQAPRLLRHAAMPPRTLVDYRSNFSDDQIEEFKEVFEL
jgi:hypothetical protein